MSYLLHLTTSQCFSNQWVPVYGVYWAVSSTSRTSAKIHMSETGGYCPSGEAQEIRHGYTKTYSNGMRVTLEDLQDYGGHAIIRIHEPSEEDSNDQDFGFGRAEITQTNIGNGLIFNVGSKIECSLRVMNTGEDGKIYGAVGLGYHDAKGAVFFTGKYMIDDVEIPSGGIFTWNPSIEVLHKDYTAREMTPRGSAVYFMSGHDEQGKVVWDRSEYIPVELILESEYVDPTDPEGVPEDWDEPVYDPSRPWDIPSIPSLLPSIWDIIMPEPKDEDEFNMMPFIYIGFMGLIGYMLIRSQ